MSKEDAPTNTTIFNGMTVALLILAFCLGYQFRPWMDDVRELREAESAEASPNSLEAILEGLPDHTATLESHAELLRLYGSAMIQRGWIVQDGDQLRLVPVKGTEEELKE